MIDARFGHVNIVARDWRALAARERLTSVVTRRENTRGASQ
ncbi:MAG: hypothetical protein ABIZ72_02420 [Candidatus Limnocylindrales bacterium]